MEWVFVLDITVLTHFASLMGVLLASINQTRQEHVN